MQSIKTDLLFYVHIYCFCELRQFNEAPFHAQAPSGIRRRFSAYAV